MNKKKLIYGLIIPLLAVAIVSAAVLIYYAQFWITLNITQQIDVNGNIPYTTNMVIDCDAGDTCYGDELKISNSGDEDKTITITTDEGCNAEADISYVGKLKLTKKNTETWTAVGDPIKITYIVVDDTFEVSGVPEEYTLIYYKDAVIGLEGRLQNPQPAIEIVSDIGDLPQSNDANLDADYSEAPDYYAHKTGAKLWAVPDSAILDGNVLDWSQWDDFYYETDLVYYFANSDGEITIPAGSFITVYPAFDVEGLAYGTCNTLITIA